MINVDTPSINVADKSNEENIQSIKAWAAELIGQLNYQISQLEGAITALQAEIETMKGDKQ